MSDDTTRALSAAELETGSIVNVAPPSSNISVSSTTSAGSTVPTGSLLMYAALVAPSGWLICDGSAVSRTGFSSLFGSLGTLYGTGDGTSTFNLPDLRGRVPVGLGTNADVSTLGNNEGVSVANRRSKHRHSPHTHTVPVQGSTGGSNGVQNGLLSGNINTGSSDGGSGNASDSLDSPSYLVLNYIIKT